MTGAGRLGEEQGAVAISTYVIGTAGHIDHGKSTLIHALTEMHPDRLQAERERGMTIDLGFAWFTLPSGAEVGVVDVPGHHRFIENMLAGVGGLRLTLLVVAADDGWMPQTQEHAEILDLLGVERAVVVLTKRDAVDEDWLELVREDVTERLEGTALAGAPTVAVSAATGAGLDRLVALLDEELSRLPPAADAGRPRLWVDRVFSIRGAGTVVTGTLAGGELVLEQPVTIEPGGRKARVRGLQTHARTVERARPGTRVAVNVAGVDVDHVQRGDALCAGPRTAPSTYVNVALRLLADGPHELVDLTSLQLYVGAAATPCRLRPLDRDVARPGERVLAQLWLERPAPLQFGDRFVLRDKTYQRTVGGGFVIEPAAARVRRPSLRLVGPRPRWRLPAAPKDGPSMGGRRLDLDTLHRRRALAAAGPEAYGGLVAVLLRERGVVSREQLVAEIPLPAPAVAAAADALVASGGGPEDAKGLEAGAVGRVVALPSFLIAAEAWDAFTRAVVERVAAFHKKYPLRPGVSRETVRTGLDVPPRLFDECIPLLVEEGHVAAEDAVLRLPDYELTFTPRQHKDVERLERLLAAEPYGPPLWGELLSDHGFDAELLTALVGRGDLVKVSDELVFPAAVVEDVRRRVTAHIEAHDAIDVAALRDMLGTSRKYALPLLEHFDRVGVTRRVGDRRVLAG